MKIKISKNKYQELEVGDHILLTYKGSNYDTGLIGTSMIAIVENIVEDYPEDRSDYALSIQIINDNADETKAIKFEAGRVVKVGIRRLCKYYTSSNGTIMINNDYIELIKL